MLTVPSYPVGDLMNKGTHMPFDVFERIYEAITGVVVGRWTHLAL